MARASNDPALAGVIKGVHDNAFGGGGGSGGGGGEGDANAPQEACAQVITPVISRMVHSLRANRATWAVMDDLLSSIA